jgi:hypothetical protein
MDGPERAFCTRGEYRVGHLGGSWLPVIGGFVDRGARIRGRCLVWLEGSICVARPYYFPCMHRVAHTRSGIMRRE